MATIDIEDKVIDIEDLGVTMRTILAAAATGYKQTDKRRWGIRYKNVVIGNVQVASTPKPAVGTLPAELGKNASIGNVQVSRVPSHESLHANQVFAELDKKAAVGNQPVASSHRPGSLQASLVLVGLA